MIWEGITDGKLCFIREQGVKRIEALLKLLLLVKNTASSVCFGKDSWMNPTQTAFQ
jgi:hypothetical protein